jgi:Glutathione S-transferase, N-terminal domain
LQELGDVPVIIQEVGFRQRCGPGILPAHAAVCSRAACFRYRTRECRFLKSAEYLKLHPLGKLPVLTDGKELLLHESGAIMLYLLERFGAVLLVAPYDQAFTRHMNIPVNFDPKARRRCALRKKWRHELYPQERIAHCH